MTDNENEPIVQDKQSFVFGLPLTEEEKQTIIDILRKDFVWEEGNSSYQIKKTDTKDPIRKNNRIVRYKESFEENVKMNVPSASSFMNLQKWAC